MSDVFDTGILPSELDPARPRPIETPWGSFSLFVAAGRSGARVRCVQSFCPHLGGPLFQGTVAGEIVMCPWHQWCFDLETGRRVDLAGQLFPGRVALAVCAVSLSPRRTIQLATPR